MPKKKDDDLLREPYVLKVKCSGCTSEYEIHCTMDRGGTFGPKHCCYCDKKFIEEWTPPPDPFHPYGQVKD